MGIVAKKANLLGVESGSDDVALLVAALVGARVGISVLDVSVTVSGSLGLSGSVGLVDVPAVGGEELVDLLEVPALGLGKHEVDDRDPASVEDGKDDVGLPLDVLESRGGELDNGEVEDPVACGGESRTLGPDGKGKNLGGNEPDSSLETEGEEEFEDEEHGGSSSAVDGSTALLGLLDQASLDSHDQSHTGDARNEKLLTADSVNKEEREDGAEHQAHVKATGHDGRFLLAEADRLGKQGAGVVDKSVDA